MLPILQNNNNAVLSSLKAMPSKDLTSDNGSSFSLGRINYVEGFYQGNPNYVTMTQHKKWINRNQDASNVIASRRINSIGVGTLNASQKDMSFMAGNEVNTVYNALNRVRNQGYVVPKKVSQKNLDTSAF